MPHKKFNLRPSSSGYVPTLLYRTLKNRRRQLLRDLHRLYYCQKYSLHKHGGESIPRVYDTISKPCTIQGRLYILAYDLVVAISYGWAHTIFIQMSSTYIPLDMFSKFIYDLA